MGPMPWTINSEIYPVWARSTGNSITTCVNWVANLIISMTFLTLTETITRQGVLWTDFHYNFLLLSGFNVIYPSGDAHACPVKDVALRRKQHNDWIPCGKLVLTDALQTV